MTNRDPNFRILAACSQSLFGQVADESSEWNGSPFEWIKSRRSRQIGKIGELLVSGWMATRGFDVAKSPDSNADRIIEGKRVEIKLSTLWENGRYKFQQLRDQNYELAICLGLSPFEAHCWIIPKADILRLWKIEKVISSQHGGAAGADTAWIDVNPNNVQGWIHQYGGTLSDAVKKLTELTGFTPNRVLEEVAEYDADST